jgi:hypothetical protein
MAHDANVAAAAADTRAAESFRQAQAAYEFLPHLKAADLDYAPPKDLPLTDLIDFLKSNAWSPPKK